MATKIHSPGREPISAALLDRWAAVPVTIVSDVLRGRGLVDEAIRPIRPFELGGRRMAGPAITAWCERGDIGSAIHAIDIADEGDVVVVDAGGCGLTAYVGELLCGRARQKKLGGVIINGAARDTDVIASWPDLPVFSRGTTARGPLSKERGTVNDQIVFGGAPVSPGDLVLADNDGIIVVPRAQIESLLPAVEGQVQTEKDWAARIAEGRPLREIFAAPGAS